jgi:hypothetical protein
MLAGLSNLDPSAEIVAGQAVVGQYDAPRPKGGAIEQPSPHARLVTPTQPFSAARLGPNNDATRAGFQNDPGSCSTRVHRVNDTRFLILLAKSSFRFP